jgi:hypothetical protein
MTKVKPCLFALLLPLLAGCESAKEHTFTGQLWSNEFLINHHEPANDPAAKAFLKSDHKDVLITYDEQQERNDTIKRWAFFVLENQWLLEARRKPHFVSLKTAAGLEPVPIFWETNRFETNTISSAVVFSTNHQTLQIVLTNQNQGKFTMPVYADGHGRETQLLLTPLAVTGDAAVASAVLGVLAWWGLAQGGHTFHN